MDQTLNYKTIQFALEYDKLKIPNTNLFVDKAILLDVHEIKYSAISSHFLKYDTKNRIGYFEPDHIEFYLLLIFHEPISGHTFTSLRKANNENRKKYYRSLGWEFKIEILR